MTVAFKIGLVAGALSVAAILAVADFLGLDIFRSFDAVSLIISLVLVLSVGLPVLVLFIPRLEWSTGSIWEALRGLFNGLILGSVALLVVFLVANLLRP